VTYKNDLHEKDGAWKADAKIAAGVDDLDNTHPLNCTEDGTLEVDITGTSGGPIDVIVDNVVPVTIQGQPIQVELTATPVIDIGEVSILPAPTTVNIFATADASFGIETTILSYTNVGIKWVTQVIGWGQYDGEFLVRINGTIVGGGRTSAADRTLQLTEPFPTAMSDVITVTILEYGPGAQNFRANLIGQ
jgi:hypothetical protein